MASCPQAKLETSIYYSWQFYSNRNFTYLENKFFTFPTENATSSLRKNIDAHYYMLLNF